MKPEKLLRDISKRYPGCWKTASDIITDAPMDWPDWCFMPVAGWYAIVSNALGVDSISKLEDIQDVAVMAATGAWRLGKDTYQIDPDVYDAVVSTRIDDAIPHDIFFRLPAWGIYVQMKNAEIDGFFAYLECDANTGQIELRLLFLYENEEVRSVPLHIGHNETLQHSLDQMIGEANKHVPGFPKIPVEDAVRDAVNLLLYICSDNADYSPSDARPTKYKPAKTKKGFRYFEAEKPRFWELGKETGYSIRRLTATNSGSDTGKRPHIRRAHWHGFWTGPRSGERVFGLKWLAPIVVGAGE